VQYKGQVVGSHERTVSVIDSVQLQRNIQELMRKVKLQAEADSLALVEEAKAAASDTAAKEAVTTASIEKPNPVPARQQPQVTKAKSNPVKNTTSNIKKKPAPQQPAPKAVMKKRSN
jgi:hypothetical protein